MTQEALKLALEALEFFEDTAVCQADIDIATEAITAIKEVLAQHDSIQAKPEPEQEPAAWVCKRDDGHFDVLTDQTCKKCFPVYTTPPQQPRVVFPTMLRKMWSGSEVQAWLDENVNKEKNNG